MDFGLSTQQLTVISALSSGATMTDAASEAGVHRNTLSNWRRNSLPFQFAFSHSQYDRALYFREKMESHIDLAIQTLHDLLADPGTPAGIRLKAALAVIDLAANPPDPKKRDTLEIEKITVQRSQPGPVPESCLAPAPEVHQELHSSAQPQPAAPRPTAPPRPHPLNLHNSAQPPITIRRDHPKVGRNDACPCGSGKKFKRCCLDRQNALASAA